MAGYTTLGDPRFVPILLKNNTWQAQAALTNVRGAHNLRAGVAVVRRSMAPIQSNDGTGLYTFTATPTNNGAGGGGDAAAAFLLGYPFTVARAHLVVDTTLETWEPSVFVQDDWRAREWLTLNLGVRYDIFTPFTEEDGEISNLDINTLEFLIPGQNGAGDTAGVKTDYGNIAPRLGFAATVRQGTVIRGGYGLSFFPSSMASNAVLRNTPFTFTYAATNAAGSGGLPNVFFSTPLPTPVQGTPAVAGTIAAVDTNLKSSYLHQYNVMLEQQWWGGSVTVGYVGSKGRRLWMGVPNLNYAPAGPGAINPRRYYAAAAPNLTTLGILRSAGEQDYNALQLAFARRSRNGLTLTANYTLAKGMSDVTQPGGGGAQQAYGVDPTRIHELEWSAERHRHPAPLCLRAQLRAAVRPRRQRRHQGPPRRLAGEPAGLLAERRAVHGLQRQRAQQHRRRRRPPQPDLLGRARRSDRRPVVRHLLLRRPGRQHHRQFGPQQPLWAAAAAHGRVGLQGHRVRRASGCSCAWRSSTSPTRRASRCPTAPWERPPSGGSRRPATTSRGSSSSRRSSCSRPAARRLAARRCRSRRL